jgi:hypothetical protein
VTADPFPSLNKTDGCDITITLFKVELNTDDPTNKYTINVHYRKIKFAWAIETVRKVSFWLEFLSCFAVSANEFCTYIVFILQCQKVLKQLPNCLKRAETGIVLIKRWPLSCSHLYCYHFLPFALHKSGTKYHWSLFDPFISTQYHMIAG